MLDFFLVIVFVLKSWNIVEIVISLLWNQLHTFLCLSIDSTFSSLNADKFNKFICFSNCLFLKISVTIQTFKHPGSLSSKDRKKLADMAVACYTEQVRK